MTPHLPPRPPLPRPTIPWPKPRALKKQGDDEMETLRFAEAADDYKAAYMLSPSAVLLYNRARALQGLGNLGEALTLFEQFNTDADADTKARVHGFDKLLAEVRSQVTTLSVTCNVPGITVRIYGKAIGQYGRQVVTNRPSDDPTHLDRVFRPSVIKARDEA